MMVEFIAAALAETVISIPGLAHKVGCCVVYCAHARMMSLARKMY